MTTVGTTDAGWQGVEWLERLVRSNLGLVVLQALSAGFLMSGYAPALTLHKIGAVALQFGALLQAVTALVLWRRHRVSTRVWGASIGLLVLVFLQVGLGYRRSYWLHVPMGVALFGGLLQQVTGLKATAATTR